MGSNCRLKPVFYPIWLFTARRFRAKMKSIRRWHHIPRHPAVNLLGKVSLMEMKRSVVERPGHRLDSGFGFSLSIGVGLILFIGGLVIALMFEDGNHVGLIFGIPMIVAGVVVPLFMLRDTFRTSEIVSPCPVCGTTIKTSDGTLQLDCPSCGNVLLLKNGQFCRAT
jgi:predicted RNA-binding Zn-ribbon protein involved in translation (DUF1610 family)